MDRDSPQLNQRYQPGIGPLKEAEAVKLALGKLRVDTMYQHAGPCKYPNSLKRLDLLIPAEWAIEFKLVRPFGDNGKENEHWIEDLLYPYPPLFRSSGSPLTDSFKLVESGFSERKAVMIFGFEHDPPMIDLSLSVSLFEELARYIGINLGLRQECKFGPLQHKVHRIGKVFGWEVNGIEGNSAFKSML